MTTAATTDAARSASNHERTNEGHLKRRPQKQLHCPDGVLRRRLHQGQNWRQAVSTSNCRLWGVGRWPDSGQVWPTACAALPILPRSDPSCNSTR